MMTCLPCMAERIGSIGLSYVSIETVTIVAS